MRLPRLPLRWFRLPLRCAPWEEFMLEGARENGTMLAGAVQILGGKMMLSESCRPMSMWKGPICSCTA